MQTKNISKRIALSMEASKQLNVAISEMKTNRKFIKVNESKLADQIIIIFFEYYYKKNKERLEQNFFDKRAYLKCLIENSKSDEELIDSVSKYLNPQRKRGLQKVQKKSDKQT